MFESSLGYRGYEMKKKNLTIRECIERGISAIERGEIRWTRGALRDSQGRCCILGAAAEMEERAGGIKGRHNFRDAFASATMGLAIDIEDANDLSHSFLKAVSRVRAVMDSHPKFFSQRPREKEHRP